MMQFALGRCKDERVKVRSFRHELADQARVSIPEYRRSVVPCSELVEVLMARDDFTNGLGGRTHDDGVRRYLLAAELDPRQ